MGTYDVIWFVLLAPLVGALIQALIGKAVVRRMGPKQGKRLMGMIAVLPIALAFVVGAALTYQLAQLPPESRAQIITGFDWINIFSIRIPVEVLIDPLSMTMVLIITGIGSLIHLYATGYMAEEKDYTRFFTYLNLFIAFMLILVLGNNLPLMFIGWEGVGLCSYLLIGFWYKDHANARAANKAFIVNRIGDFGLTLGMFLLMVYIVGTFSGTVAGMGTDSRWLSFDVINRYGLSVLEQNPTIVTVIALLLFVGAMGKSAQFPLYFWLPDAMAGPTPVSALIHAATMVTAGVFMLNRLHGIFELTPIGMGIIAIIGAFTAIFAALIAFGQTDIKKVLAYSTVSQLGFMFVACGVGAFYAGMFHVMTHAFFKALLFLGSGAVIHAMAHDQDMRNYGNLKKYLRITTATMLIGWLAIAGVVPFAGFWSKESILANALGNEAAILGGINVGVITGWVLLLVALLTAAYMTRLTMLTFYSGQERWRMIPAEGHHHDHAHHDAADAHHGHAGHEDAHAAHADGHGHGEHHDDPHGFFYTDEEMAARQAAEEHEHHHALDETHQPHEVPPSMAWPLIILAILSTVGGLVYLGEIFKKWLYPNGLIYLGKDVVPGHPHNISTPVLIALSLAAAGIGILWGIYHYRKGLPKDEQAESGWKPWRRAASQQFGYDNFVMGAGVEGGGVIANALWKRFDVGFIDGIVNGLAWLTGQVGRGLRILQSGFVRTYALIMLLGAVTLLGYFWYLAMRLGGGN